MLQESFRERIISKMREHGYEYDDLASYPHYLAFNYDGQTFPLVFKSWGEVDDWESNMVWDA